MSITCLSFEVFLLTIPCTKTYSISNLLEWYITLLPFYCVKIKFSIYQMCNKSEQMLVTDSESVGYPAEEQRSNIKTVNCLFAFESGMRNCVEDSALMDHPQARNNVLESLSKVESLIR